MKSKSNAVAINSESTPINRSVAKHTDTKMNGRLLARSAVWAPLIANGLFSWGYLVFQIYNFTFHHQNKTATEPSLHSNGSNTNDYHCVTFTMAATALSTAALIGFYNYDCATAGSQKKGKYEFTMDTLSQESDTDYDDDDNDDINSHDSQTDDVYRTPNTKTNSSYNNGANKKDGKENNVGLSESIAEEEEEPKLQSLSANSPKNLRRSTTLRQLRRESPKSPTKNPGNSTLNTNDDSPGKKARDSSEHGLDS